MVRFRKQNTKRLRYRMREATIENHTYSGASCPCTCASPKQKTIADQFEASVAKIEKIKTKKVNKIEVKNGKSTYFFKSGGCPDLLMVMR